jgi:hypothetical protein
MYFFREAQCRKCEGIIDKFLKVLQGNLGSEGRASQFLEKSMNIVCLKMNDDDVFVRYIAQQNRNTTSLVILVKIITMMQEKGADVRTSKRGNDGLTEHRDPPEANKHTCVWCTCMPRCHAC